MSPSTSNASLQLSHPTAAPDNRSVTRCGIIFDRSEDRWSWTDGVFPLALDFTSLPAGVAAFRSELKEVLAVTARSKSARHLTALFHEFRAFGLSRPPERAAAEIAPIDLANYGAALGLERAWRQALVKILLQRWVALGLPGVDPECAAFYDERRIPGNAKGHAVRTHDPHRGPFTEAEYTGLYKAVDAAFGQGELPLWAMVLTRLLFALGARISQYASLKLADLTVQGGKHILNMPQVKKRHEHSRVEFLACELTAQTAALVRELIAHERSLGATDGSPLFSRTTVMPIGMKPVEKFDPLFEGHCTSNNLSRLFKAYVQPLAPLTERLGFMQMPINTKRFRYTLGTRLAEEGASLYVIAERLGHSDTQNVQCYIAASAKVVENIDRAMTPMLAPIAQAFRGRLIEGEADSTQQGAVGTRIIDFRVSTAGVGSCGGQPGGCSLLRPVACYTCFQFEPWLDAPHEQLLQRLQEDRTRFAGDERMAAINDDAIIAVQEVIAACEEAKRRRQGLLA